MLSNFKIVHSCEGRGKDSESDWKLLPAEMLVIEIEGGKLAGDGALTTTIAACRLSMTLDKSQSQKGSAQICAYLVQSRLTLSVERLIRLIIIIGQSITVRVKDYNLSAKFIALTT